MLARLALTLMLIALAGFMPAWGPPGQPLPASAAVGDAKAAPSPRVARLEHDLEQAVARAQPVFDRYGYLAVFLTILVEGVGIPAPGQTFLIAAALSAAHGKLSLVWVLILACLAAGLGNSLGYLLGRWGGRRLLARFKVRGIVWRAWKKISGAMAGYWCWWRASSMACGSSTVSWRVCWRCPGKFSWPLTSWGPFCGPGCGA